MNETPGTNTSWLRQHWPRVVFFVVGLVAIVFIGLAIVLFMAWRASPEKALSDAVQYAVDAPGSYSITMNGDAMTLATDGQRQSLKGTYRDMPFEAIVDGNVLYVKSSTPDKFASMFVPKSGLLPAVVPVINQVVASLKDRWVSMDTSKLPYIGTDTNNMKCLLNARSQLVTNRMAKGELADSYASNRFLDIQTKSTTATEATYHVSLNEEKVNAFADKLSTTKFYQSLSSDCSGFVGDFKKLGSKPVGIDVTITKSEHRLKTIVMGDVHVAANDASVDTISIPKDAVAYDSLAMTVTESVFKSLWQRQ